MLAYNENVIKIRTFVQQTGGTYERSTANDD